jgi:hypothetical protein
MNQAMNTQEVVADFFAHGYRVSGAFPVGSQNLSDAIFDPNTSYLLIKDAYLSPITDPATISAYYETMLLDKTNLDFVFTMDPRDAMRRDQRYRAGNMYEVSIAMTVPFFELQGKTQTVSRSFDPRTFLSNEAGAFITLMDVTARCTFRPEIQYQGGAAIISRKNVSFFGEKSETTP